MTGLQLAKQDTNIAVSFDCNTGVLCNWGYKMKIGKTCQELFNFYFNNELKVHHE